MLYQKQGFPEEDELVLCTVTSVQYNSVFVTLDEFGNKTGMIHISEVSPGRIRNIRDFVVEGKKVICKVLRVNQERGHIDLSLRRVNESQRRQKNDQIKQELKAEKIVQSYAEQKKIPLQEAYNAISEPILREYSYLHEAFQAVVEENLDLSASGLKTETAQELAKLVIEKIKPKEVEVEGNLKLQSYDENGLDLIKSSLVEAKKTHQNVRIRYIGGGSYRISVKAPEYKEAEKILKTAIDTATGMIQKKKGTFEFRKIEAK